MKILLKSLLLLFLLVVLTVKQQTRAAVANLGIAPKTSRCITFPKTSYEDCYTDDEQHLPGKCTLLEDCPAALGRWEQEHVLPNTCYFDKFDQYICCALPKTTEDALPVLPIFRLTQPSLERPVSERAKPPDIQFVVGGTPTALHEFPFMAALGWKSNFDNSIIYRCGGTLIAPRFVLTAAHCINFSGQMPTTVRLGGDNLTLSVAEDRKISRVYMHPDYESNTSYNDIALLKLDIPSIFAISHFWYLGSVPEQNLTALGYGNTQFAGASSSQLLKVPLQIYTNDECRKYYQRDVLSEGLAASQMCAGDTNAMHDTCQGDSGGPLLMNYDSKWYVVGVTSLGQGCASGPPSIYTRVSSFLGWIESIVNVQPNVNEC